MKALLLLLSFSTCISTLSFGQNIYTKDGVDLGSKSNFINSCVEKANAEILKLEGIEIKAKKYCSCVANNLLPTIMSEDLNKAVEEGSMSDLLLSGDNLTIIIDCAAPNASISDEFVFEEGKSSDLMKEIGVKEIEKSPELADLSKEQATYYCSCSIDKLFEKGISYGNLKDVEDENSVIFNEIIVTCMTEAIELEPTITDSTRQVTPTTKNIETSEVELINVLNQGYKVKINIGGTIKYFLLDSGASDMLISKDLEKELLKDNIISKEDYIGETEYSLADNSTVKADLIRLNHVKIGDFEVDDVVVGVIKNGSLLCGLSLLNKFKSWEIDKEKNLLILKK